MSQIQFLFDENVNPALLAALSVDEPSIFTLKVGEIGSPPLGTKDPELLVFAEENEFAIVSFDKNRFLSTSRITWLMGDTRVE